MRCKAYQGLSAERAKIKKANFEDDGAIVELIDEGGGLFTLVRCFPDAPDVVSAAPARAAPPSPADAALAGATGSNLLGTLSRAFESNGRPAAIGYDKNGGFSYGQYQIACRPGTMATYLRFLEQRFPALAQPLQRAGGADAAALGSEAFKVAWRLLAADPVFAESQHAFIAETHYLPFARHLRESLGLDLVQRSAALRDVAWSVAVQHGPGNSVFDNALKPLGQPLPDDDVALINAIYDERAHTEKYFSNSTPEVRTAVANRFKRERQLAINQALSPGTALA